MLQPLEVCRKTVLPVTTRQLRDVIAGADTLVKIDQLKDATPFRDAGADSLDFFNVIMAVEDAYHLRIPSEDIGNVTTLKSMAAYLNQRLS